MDRGPVVEVSWTPDWQDYAEATRRSWVLSRMWLKLTAALALLCFGLAAIGTLNRDWGFVVVSLVMLPVAVLAVFFLETSGPAARRLMRRQPLLAEFRCVQLDPEQGMRVVMPSGTSDIPWSSFKQVHEMERNFMLTLPGRSKFHVLVAKRGIVPPATSSDVARLLTAAVRPAPVVH